MNREKIAEKLRLCRGSRTMNEVAEAIGISASALSMYENAERIPKDDIKIKLSKYYKKSILWLFYAD